MVTTKRPRACRKPHIRALCWPKFRINWIATIDWGMLRLQLAEHPPRVIRTAILDENDLISHRHRIQHGQEAFHQLCNVPAEQ